MKHIVGETRDNKPQGVHMPGATESQTIPQPQGTDRHWDQTNHKKGTTHMSNYQCRKCSYHDIQGWAREHQAMRGHNTGTRSREPTPHDKVHKTSGRTSPGTQDQCLSQVSRPLWLRITGKPSSNVNLRDAPWLILLDPSDASVTLILCPVIWSLVHMTKHVMLLPLPAIGRQCLLVEEETWHVQLFCQHWRILLLVTGGTSWQTWWTRAFPHRRQT